MHNAIQWNTTRTTHCTTSTELLLSATDGASATWRTSFMLQQCCHYFVSNPCNLSQFISTTSLKRANLPTVSEACVVKMVSTQEKTFRVNRYEKKNCVTILQRSFMNVSGRIHQSESRLGRGARSLKPKCASASESSSGRHHWWNRPACEEGSRYPPSSREGHIECLKFLRNIDSASPCVCYMNVYNGLIAMVL
jgi:hypothetical protein